MENQTNQNPIMYVGRNVKVKSIGLCILFSIITCGIYSFVWFYSLTEDVNELSGDRTATSGGMAILFSIITCGIYNFFWMYRQGKMLDSIENKDNTSSGSTMGIVYLVLSFVGLGIVSYALMQDRINDIVGK